MAGEGRQWPVVTTVTIASTEINNFEDRGQRNARSLIGILERASLPARGAQP
jgi:hypothetical protein